MSPPSPSTDLARVAEVLAQRGLALGAPLVVAPSTGSTNDDAKRGARAGAPHGSLWIAESQTGGRGRQGRAWHARPGEDLLFSLLLRLRCVPARVPPVSLAVGLAVRDAVARALGGAEPSPDVLVKWPNDVVVRSARDGALRKVAGVLVESALSGSTVEHVVVGVGVNVRSRAWPDEVAATATSIALERAARSLDGELDRAELLADVLTGVLRDAELVALKGLTHVLARLEQHDALRGKVCESVEAAGGPPAVRGVASGIDADGRLLVRTEEGALLRIGSGELRLRPT
jgi:BirA family biotin operon repressor/biotin-[acetyl-CoA-carboxylase] ligase